MPNAPDDPAGPPQSHWDWRDHSPISPPKNQGGTQLCLATALCASIEARHAIAHPGQGISLAPAFVHSCLGGLEPGQPFGATYALPLVTQYGIAYAPPDVLPYPTDECESWKNGTKQPYRIAGAAQIRGPNHAKNAILARGPIIAEMWLIPTFKTYTGGIYVQTPFANTGIPGVHFDTHVACVVGFDDLQKYWIVKNSFGPGWGPYGGFGLVGYGSCSLLLSPDVANSNPTSAFEAVL